MDFESNAPSHASSFNVQISSALIRRTCCRGSHRHVFETKIGLFIRRVHSHQTAAARTLWHVAQRSTRCRGIEHKPWTLDQDSHRVCMRLIDHLVFISMVHSCRRAAALTDGQTSPCLGRLVAVINVDIVTTGAVPLCGDPCLGSRSRTVAVIQRTSALCYPALAIGRPRWRYQQRQCRIANPVVCDTRSRQCEQPRGR